MAHVQREELLGALREAGLAGCGEVSRDTLQAAEHTLDWMRSRLQAVCDEPMKTKTPPAPSNALQAQTWFTALDASGQAFSRRFAAHLIDSMRQAVACGAQVMPALAGIYESMSAELQELGLHTAPESA